MKLSIPMLAAGALAAFASSAESQTKLPKTPAPPLAGAARESSAQFSSASAAERFHPLRAGVVYAEESEHGLWAATARYKMRIEAEGASFVPFLGSHQPRSAPLTFRLESVLAGGESISCAALALRRTGDRVAIERGAIEEIWQLSGEGAEQSFVIETPAARGEIVVRVGFAGEYAAALDAQGILFSGELGAIRYGLAFAFDAAGQRTAVRESLEGDSILLCVPATFVERAVFPITIDPWVTTYGVETTSAAAVMPDVAYESTTDRYLYVYEVVQSQTDHDVYSVLATDSGVLPGTLRAIDASTTDWAHARTASNSRAQSFLVVAEVGPDGSQLVAGRLVDALDGNLGPMFHLTPGISGEQIRPDVGGDPNDGLSSQFCLVWERVLDAQNHDILSRLVDPEDCALSPLVWLESTSALASKPAISSSCGLDEGGPAHWTVVWQKTYSAQDEDLYGAQIAADGSIHTPTFAVEGSSWNDVDPVVSPIVEGSGPHRPYAVVWSRSQGPGDHDIHVRSFIGDQGTPLMNLSGAHPLATRDDVTPRVETDGHLFAVAFTKAAGPNDADIWLAWAYAAGDGLVALGPHEAVAATTELETHPALVSEHSGGASSRRLAIACELDQGAESDILGILVDAPAQVPIELVCSGGSFLCPCGHVGQPGGCSNSQNPAGSFLTPNGIAKVSADSLVLTANGMPDTVPCLFLQGTELLNGGAGIPFGDGLRCVGGSIVRLATKVSQWGYATYPQTGDPAIAEKGSIPSVGATRYYQVWYRDPANFCMPEGFNLSNALKVTWLP